MEIRLIETDNDMIYKIIDVLNAFGYDENRGAL